jgi:hypothetical protein
VESNVKLHVKNANFVLKKTVFCDVSSCSPIEGRFRVRTSFIIRVMSKNAFSEFVSGIGINRDGHYRGELAEIS